MNELRQAARSISSRAYLTKTGCVPISVTDLRLVAGGGSGNCERCGRCDLRFLHLIERPDGRRMIVGCECAKRLCYGYDPNREESKLRSRYTRRSQWLTRSWGLSWKGNHTLKVKHDDEWLRITVFPNRFYPKLFSYSISRDGKKPEYSVEKYVTADDAKRGSIDALAMLLNW